MIHVGPMIENVFQNIHKLVEIPKANVILKATWNINGFIDQIYFCSPTEMKI